MKTLLIITSIMLLAISVCMAGSGSKAPKSNTYVIVASGLIIDYEEDMYRDLSLTNIRQFFLKAARLDKNLLTVFVEADSAARQQGDPCSTASELLGALDELAGRITDADRFVFYYLGQANIAEGKLRFNLPGKDITHEQLADAIRSIRAASKLIILDCPGAGLAIRSLSFENNVVIAGARSDQPYSTRFSQYFVPSLTDPNSDTNTDGGVSLLEAFTAACQQLDEFYDSQDLLKIENAMLEDDGDGVGSQRPWKYQDEGHDGALADNYFLCETKKDTQ